MLMRQPFCGEETEKASPLLNLGTGLLRTGKPDDGGTGCRPPSVLRRQRPENCCASQRSALPLR